MPMLEGEQTYVDRLTTAWVSRNTTDGALRTASRRESPLPVHLARPRAPAPRAVHPSGIEVGAARVEAPLSLRLSFEIPHGIVPSITSRALRTWDLSRVDLVVAHASSCVRSSALTSLPTADAHPQLDPVGRDFAAWPTAGWRRCCLQLLAEYAAPASARHTLSAAEPMVTPHPPAT